MSTPRLETFSYLPEMTLEQVEAQIRSTVERGLVVGFECTDDPDPYDHYWTLWKLPLFGVTDPSIVLARLEECRAANPDSYIRVNGYDSVRQGQVVSFVVQRPEWRA
jgi:ribulose-bisphosphate carboxylase small chain